MKRKQLFRPIRLLGTVLAPLALIWPASVSPQSTASRAIPLAKIAGDWRGDGWAVGKDGEAKEAVRCRLKARYKASSRKLALSGKCAATSGTYTLLGHIADYSGTNKVTGRWVNPRGIGSVNISGKRTGNRLTFFYNGKDKKTKRKTRYTTIWDLRANNFSLSTGVDKGSSDALGKITFKR